MPSGRPVEEEVTAVEVAASQTVKADDPRRQLEQKLEESMNSLLKTIRSDITGG